MIDNKADSTVVAPVPAFSMKIIFWNTTLHFLQLVFILTDVISSKGAVPLVRLNGTVVGWFMTTILLLLVAFIATHWKIVGKCLILLVYLGICLYNFIRDVHWHLFGGILTFSRFSEGATRILLDGAPEGEIWGILNGYLLFELGFCLNNNKTTSGLIPLINSDRKRLMHSCLGVIILFIKLIQSLF